MGILIASVSFSCSLMAATQTGIASVYSGEQTANGEFAHAFALTAAHRTLPFGTMVKVTNTQTDRSERQSAMHRRKCESMGKFAVGGLLATVYRCNSCLCCR